MKKIGIYIHIPFCVKKCSYCDFTSFEGKEEYIEKYIESLKKEIENNFIVNNLIEKEKYEVDTIYIGGGTPSSINSKYIKEVIDVVKEKFNLSNNIECSIEVNPGTVDKEKIKKYKETGINRISIGLQATQNKLLKEIGRIHTFEDFLNCYELVKKVGFTNINVDLMLGLPNQTLDDIESSIDKIIKLDPKHISVYSLIVEEETLMNKWIEEGKLKLPEEDVERKMYWNVKNKLEKNGYIHYEISNFAKIGSESKHNLNCWNQKEYIGFGLAAHSYFNNKRYCNTDNLKEYIKNIEEDNYKKNIQICEIQNELDKKKEYMLLGLRKIDGIDIQKFKNKFVDNPIFLFHNELEKLSDKGLIEIDLNNIKLTNKGLDLANIVWEEFV